jgi:hypothetical protein
MSARAGNQTPVVQPAAFSRFSLKMHRTKPAQGRQWSVERLCGAGDTQVLTATTSGMLRRVVSYKLSNVSQVLTASIIRAMGRVEHAERLAT